MTRGGAGRGGRPDSIRRGGDGNTVLVEFVGPPLA